MRAIRLFLCSVLAMTVLNAAGSDRPKLVVGIVVDQMRWDYLERFADRFGTDGFRRLTSEGFNCDNTLVDYLPTVTALGHTCIYTGSVPSIHGIAGNNFREGDTWVYCTDDASVQSVGTTSKSGLMSPRKLQVTTVGDELHLATNFRSRVVSISLKDRASILPGGHTADGVYWFDDETGRFITSTYYREKLPEWIEDFNRKDLARQYLMKDWATLYPIDTYRQSTADDTPFEETFDGMKRPTLPVPTSKLFEQEGYGLIRTTPYGCTLTLDLARAAIEGEQLGRHADTDFLAISLSSTDYIGHQFGPNAIEIEDTYLRLDQDLGRFFHHLDSVVGRGEYLLFLTADHAGAHNATFLRSHKIPAGGWNTKSALARLDSVTRADLGVDASLIQCIENYQVFLNNTRINALGLDRSLVIRTLIAELQRMPEVAYVVEQTQAATAPLPSLLRERIVNGYNREHSGEIQIVLKPGFYDVTSPEDPLGTTHGVWCGYDAHIPLVFMGWNVPAGHTQRPTHMTDIAPTIAAMLHIQAPSGSIGTPITME